MSEVIRDVVVRMRLEQQKAKLEAPEVGPMQRAHEQKKAADEVQRAHNETARVVKQTGYESAIAFREGGEGALRMARGIAFLSASGSDDLKKLVQSVAVAQGAFDVFAGGFKVFSNLAAFGPAGTAVAGLTVAVGAGALAWSRYTAELERVAEAARQRAEAARQHEQSERRLAETITDVEARMRSRQTGAALTPTEKRRREDIEMAEINERTRQAEIEDRGLRTSRGRALADRIEAGRNKLEAERIGAGRYRIGETADPDEMARQRAAIPGFERQAESARKRDEELRERQLALGRQGLADQERLLHLTEQRNREEVVRLNAIESNALGTAFLSTQVLGPGGVFVQQSQQTTAQNAQRVAEMQQQLDDILKVMKEFATRTKELERDLSAANPS